MAVSILKSPDAFALTRAGRMIYQFSGNARTVTAGTKAVNQVAFTGCPDGTTVTLTWNGRSYTYTARTTPTLDTEFQAGNGNAAHVDALLNFFKNRYEIREDFTLTRSQVGTLLQAILLTAKQPDPIYNLVPYLGINSNFTTGISTAVLTPGLAPNLRSQYGVYTEVWLEKIDASAFDRIYASHLEADDTGLALFDAGSIIHSELRVDWPKFVGNTSTDDRQSARRYYVAYAEAFGSPLQIGLIKQTDPAYACYGGADYVSRAAGAFPLLPFVQGATLDLDRALRFGPLTRYVLPDEPQFLTFLNTRASVPNVSLEVKATYDNTEVRVTNVLLPVAAMQSGSKLTVPVGATQLGLVLHDNGINLQEYTVRLHQQTTTNYFCAPYRYILNYAYQPYARYFVYASSLGCVDTLVTFGKGSVELQRFFEQAEQFLPAAYNLTDGQFVDYDVSRQVQVQVTTGFRDQAELERWNDFYRSAERLRVRGTEALPISIVSKSIKQAKDGDTQFAHAFEYAYAYRDEFYTGTQADTLGDGTPPPGFSATGSVTLNPPQVISPVVDPTIPRAVRDLTEGDVQLFRQTATYGNHADAGYMSQQTASGLFPPKAFLDDALTAAQTPGSGVQVLVVDGNQGKARVATADEVHALAGSNPVVRLMAVPDNNGFDTVQDALNYLYSYPNPGDNDNPGDVVVFQTLFDFTRVSLVISQSVLDSVAQKVDKVQGKGLSANDFTDLLKAKLEALSPTSKGDKGDAGAAGTQWITASQDPATIGGTLGNIGDLLLNKGSGDVFQRINALPNNTPGTWQFVINLRGDRGPQGNPGSGGGGGSGVTYMPVPDSFNPNGAYYDYLETFPQPPAGHENDVVTWQTLGDVAVILFRILDDLQYRLSLKVDQVAGKGLSTHDLTDALYNKLVNLPTAGVKGDKGDKGDPGAQGPVGPVGPVGPAGSGSGQGSLTAFNFGGTTYYAQILTLPKSTEGTYDESILVVGLSAWDGSNKKSIRVQCSNRSGFRVSSLVQYGDANQASVVAYQHLDGTVTLHIKAPLGFNVSSVTYLSLVQTTPVSSLDYTTSVPTGTLVYDSAAVLADLAIGPNGIATRALPVAVSPQYILSRNPLGGQFEVSTLPDMIARLLGAATDDTIAALATRLGVTGNTTPAVFTAGTHYEEVADQATPYIIQYVISGQTTLPEGTTIHAYLTARYSDGSSVRNTAPVAWSINGGTPSALTLTPTNGGAELDLTLGSINASAFVTLHAAIGGGFSEQAINLIDSGCTRPASLPLHVYLAYNYVTTDTSAHLFSSLDDANNTMGRIFNEANIGITGFSKFKAELGNTNPGADVYLNWQAEGDHSCAHVSDNNYYLLDGNGNDSLKVAVRVENGVIVAQKASGYTTPAPLRITYQRQGDTASDAAGGTYLGVLSFLNEPGSGFEVQNLIDGAPAGAGTWSSPTSTSQFYVPWGNQAIAHTIGIAIRRVGSAQPLVTYQISGGNEARPVSDAQPITIYTT